MLVHLSQTNRHEPSPVPASHSLSAPFFFELGNSCSWHCPGGMDAQPAMEGLRVARYSPKGGRKPRFGVPGVWSRRQEGALLSFGSSQKRGAASRGQLPDFGVGDVQLQVHEVSLSALVQLTVFCNHGQEGVLGIKRSGRKDKDLWVTPPRAHSSAFIQECSRAGSHHRSTGLPRLLFQSTPQHETNYNPAATHAGKENRLFSL